MTELSFIQPCLWFDDQAHEAMAYHVDVFPNSRIVSCEDQDEIDRYWSKLSHVPESEQCGWCKDRFGVSWQIIPANMGELTRRPEQIQVMMRQKKIVIAELENA
jgi:predicted 3-demethylubiquinone-9 3-methyltransferase (glyoxalase superfamily)